MINPQEDYTSRGWIVATFSLAVLIVVSFIPPINVGGMSLRRASIISDIVDHPTSTSSEAEQTSPEEDVAPVIDIEEFEVDLEQGAQTVAQTTATASPTGEATSASWEGIF